MRATDSQLYRGKNLAKRNPTIDSQLQVLQAEYRGTVVAVKRVLPTAADATTGLFGASNFRQQVKRNT